MPLYSNILLSNQGDKQTKEKIPTQRSSASLKLLQDHLLSKKRAKQANLQPNKLPKLADKCQPNSSRTENEWNPDDEYDPMTPNSYELLKLEHIKAEEQRLAARKSGTRIDLSILDALDQFDDNEDVSDLKGRSTRGTAIAPPPTLQPTVMREPLHNSPEYPNLPVSTTGQTPVDKLDGQSAAAKIMAKMGYKAGQGLGKDKQGINVPLEVEPISANAGRIVEVQKHDADQVGTEPEATRILLLRNMVGPGEVDDDLEAETREECTKYGEVVKCLIYEIPSNQVPADEAVRIFVEFKSIASTKKAISDLNGRFFGGRVVKATFYSENKFNKYELAP